MTAIATKTRGRPKKIDPAAIAAATAASMALGKQQQSKTPPKAANDKQKQDGGGSAAIGKQGAAASGKAAMKSDEPAGETRGGTKQVLITEAKITGRGGRPAGIEDYPFGELKPARKMSDGSIVGPSFFIPDEDRASGKLAAARKRHRDADGTPALFWSRKVFEQVNGTGPKVAGLRIWRGTSELVGQV